MQLMPMSKARQVAVLAAVSLGIAGVAHVRAASVNFAEFTVIRAETSQGSSPTLMKRSVLQAQRADGSQVSGEVAPGQLEVPARRSIRLNPERMIVEVNENLRAMTTMYFKVGPPPQRLAPDPKCGFSRISASASQVYIGEEVVLGYKTVVIQSEERIGDNENSESYLRREWRAPDLDCTVVRLIEDRRDNSGAVTGHFELQPVKVTPGPPDPRLFQIPQDYSEKSPSQMWDAFEATPGSHRPAPTKMRERLERENQRYYANHRAMGRE